MFTRRGRAAAFVSATAVSAAMLMASPALADTGAFDDAEGDIADSVDQVRVVLVNARRVRVTIHHRDLVDRRFTERIWFDTALRNPGPEFRLEADYPFDLELKRVRNWGRPDRTRVPRACNKIAFDYDFEAETTTYPWPRRCFDANRIRVAVSVEGKDAPKDWLSGRREFTGWVRR